MSVFRPGRYIHPEPARGQGQGLQKHGRLDSLKNPQPRAPPGSSRTDLSVCPVGSCRSTNIQDEDNKTVCMDCGCVLKEHHLVTDVQFGLASAGNHVVHGHYVGDDQAYSRNAHQYDRNRALNSMEITILTGKRYLNQISSALAVTSALVESGMQLFRLAAGNNFIQGRRTKSVAAVSLYIACRLQREEQNRHMLIDFSDVLQLNVFDLGVVYKKMIENLGINGNGRAIQLINPEHLVLRFAERLEFGGECMHVANDALRVLQRMTRDWMTHGRRPAGVVGAAVIIAARMNNFRRTVREVVYVAKVQESTIFKRLDEFKATESSGLTVEEFRTIDLERFADPPAYYEKNNPKKKRGRKRKHIEFDDDGDNDNPTVIESRATSAAPSTANDQSDTPPNTQPVAVSDSQSMPPPPLPIDPSLLEVSAERLSETEESPGLVETSSNAVNPESSTSIPTTQTPPPKRRCGRPPKNPTTPPATQGTDVAVQEPEITSALTDPFSLDASSLRSTLQTASKSPSPLAVIKSTTTKTRPLISDTAEISDSEFASDAEVRNCLLTADEVAIKTRIWTHENRDYLRAQQAKFLKQKLAEENGTARVVVKRKRRRRRVGDLTSYRDDPNADESTPVAKSPAEAMVKMMKVRGYSKRINYENFRDIYADIESLRSRSRSRSISGAGSPGSGVLLSPGGQGPEGTTTQKGAEATDENADEDEGTEAGTEAGNEVSKALDEKEQEELESLAEDLEEEIYDEDPYREDDQGGYSD